MPVKHIKTAIIFFLLMTGVLHSQQDPNTKKTVSRITHKDTLIKTGDRFIIQFTDILKTDNKILSPAEDYKIDYRSGIITLSRNLFKKYMLDTTRIYDLIIEYDIFPYNIKDEYSNFEIITERDTISGDTVQFAVQKKDLIENLFEGTDLEKSGSIFRGFTFGSNRDLTLNSGFRLQLNGRLAKDVEIIAALTDENTPIQPEGNTQKLQELDKVFIELKSNNITATIGDIDVEFPGSEFISFSRKIKGAKGFGEFNFGNLFISGAVSKGKFNTNRFNGTDGVQGPYRLAGANNEINIIVLSGSEKVYIDGAEMTRGEQADYVIDYSIGQITFTNRRLITNNSRITVDFEYTDRKYSRTLIAGYNKLEFFKKRLSLGLSYINETDNENRTIDFTLSDSDRVVLRNAGNDRYKAVKSGVSLAGRDSTGRGTGAYVMADTVINNDTVKFYRFAPGDSNAVYNIVFSYVGYGRGDYNSLSTYNYKYAGKNLGSYAPVVFLPVPTSYQMAGLNLEYASSRNREFHFSIESAYSLFDRNKFSSADDSKNGGYAFNILTGINKNNFLLFGTKIYDFNLYARERIINKLFNSLDRINSVEFNRNFDVQDSLQATEELREFNMNLSPVQILNLKGNYSQLKRGDFFSSDRITASFEFNSPAVLTDTSRLPKFKYTFEKLGSENSTAGLTGNWIKHNAFINYRKFFGADAKISPILEIRFDYSGETKKNNLKGTSGDSLRFDSFSFDDLTPGISLSNLYGLALYASFNYRRDNFTSSGILSKLSNSYIQKYGISYGGIRWFNSSFDISIRDRFFSDEGKQAGNTDNNSILVNSRTRIEPFNGALLTDLFYNVTSERNSKIEKLFVLVPVGQGNYVYLGDLNSNGIQDENEFQLVNYDGNYIKLNVPTDQFFRTIALKTSVRIYLKPSRYFYLSGNGFLRELYNNTSTELSYKIDERSKDPVASNIYLLKLSNFLNDSNTITGSQIFQQDINLFENNPAYSFRLRYIQLKGFNQFSSGNERQLNIQKSLRIQLGLTRDLVTQVEYTNRTDKNTAPVNSIRNRDIFSDEITDDISYKPIQSIESGFLFSYRKATDYYPKNPTNASINQQILRFIYSFESSGRVRIELERYEVNLNTTPLNFPYELTSGRVPGKSYFWRAMLDYSISKNIQANVNYEGRVEGSKNVIHSGRAQVTAFF